MTVRVADYKTYTGNQASGIGGNSVDTTTGDCFVTITGNIVTKATSSTPIAGVSLTQKAYTSDNQTVAQAQLGYIPKDVDASYRVTITGGTITAAKEGYYYNLSDSVTVDGTTESAVKSTVDTTTGSDSATVPVVTHQVQLLKFVSATNSIFRIV